MGTCQWGIILMSVALLLDPTFADVLVQPGYGQSVAPKNSGVQSQSSKLSSSHSVIVQPQKTYAAQQNPAMQMLQQQHAIQQQQLQQIHQYEKNQLLQQQQQQQLQLQNPNGQNLQAREGEIVGLMFPHQHLIGPGMKGFGGRLFSLGPLGLNTLSSGSLGGFGPFVMSPHQSPQTIGSSQFQQSPEGSHQARTKRDVKNSGESADRKVRQKPSNSQQNNLATNPSLKSKSDINSPNSPSPKKTDEIVGDALKNDNQGIVGSNLLDPLGLMDKAGDMFDEFAHKIPNPLNVLKGGSYHGNHNSWLNKANSETPQFEEHVVGQSQQQEKNFQSQLPGLNPINGGFQQTSQQYFQPHSLPPYGMFASPYPYGQNLDRRYDTMGNQGYLLNGNSHGQGSWLGSSNFYQPITGEKSSITQDYKTQNSWSDKNNFDPITGAQNPTPELNSQGTSFEDKNPIIGSPNSWSDSGNQKMAESVDPMVGSPPNVMAAFSQLSQAAQPFLGNTNPIMGNIGGYGGNQQNFGAPGTGRMMGIDQMTGNPLIDLARGIGGQLNGYDGNSQFYDSYNYNDAYRNPNFGFDDIFDRRYDQLHNGGGYNRIYETFYEDAPPYGIRGYPTHLPHNHHHHHHSDIF